LKETQQETSSSAERVSNGKGVTPGGSPVVSRSKKQVGGKKRKERGSAIDSLVRIGTKGAGSAEPQRRGKKKVERYVRIKKPGFRLQVPKTDKEKRGEGGGGKNFWKAGEG